MTVIKISNDTQYIKTLEKQPLHIKILATEAYCERKPAHKKSEKKDRQKKLLLAKKIFFFAR